MKIKKLSIILYLAATLFSVQSASAAYCTTTQTKTRGDRYLSSFSLTSGMSITTINTLQTATTAAQDCYFDRTYRYIAVEPGAKITPIITWVGEWMHGYLWVDYNRDEVFAPKLDENGVPMEGSELVAYTFYSADGEVGYNSKGEKFLKSDPNWGYHMPKDLNAMPFTVPSDLHAGDYRARLIIISNDISGCDKSGLGQNGGSIVDFTLRVTAPERTITLEVEPVGTGTVSGGGTASGIITCIAKPNPGYVFLRWTNPTGEFVSTSSSYADNEPGNKTLVAWFMPEPYRISRTNWTVTGDNYADNGNFGPASYAIDGDLSTWWHTRYDASGGGSDISTFPHWIQFDLSKSETFTTLDYVSPTSDPDDNANILLYELYLSDTDISASLDKDYIPNASSGAHMISKGEFAYSGGAAPYTHNITLDGPVTGRYVFMRCISASNGRGFAGCNEFYIYSDYYRATVETMYSTWGIVYIGDVGDTTVEVIPDNTQTVTITAKPAQGYRFVEWRIDGVKIEGAGAEYTTPVITSSMVYEAVFEPVFNAVSASAEPLDGGSVTLNGGTDPLSILTGGTVKLTSAPAEGYHLLNWTVNGTEVSKSADFESAVINNPADFVANFSNKLINDIAFAKKEVSQKIFIGSTYEQQPVTASAGAVTYTSSNTAVATVDANSGVVSLVGTGATVITATQQVTADYDGGSASYTFVVLSNEEVKLSGSPAENVTITVAIKSDGEVSANGVLVSARANIPVDINTVTDLNGEVAVGSTSDIYYVDCGDKTKPQELSSTVEELSLRNVSTTDAVISSGNNVSKITVSVTSDGTASGVCTSSALDNGVQLVVETEIDTSRPIEGKGTPTVFNFLSMPFDVNSSAIEYLDPADNLTWRPAVAENQLRILTYNGQKRADGVYSAAWDKVPAGGSTTVAANYGFVVVGNNKVGGAAQGYKMKLRFTSSSGAYTQSSNGEKAVIASKWRDPAGTTINGDKDWNLIGAPFLTSISNSSMNQYTVYCYSRNRSGGSADFSKDYIYYVPTDNFTLNPYESFFIQAAPYASGVSGEPVNIVFNPAQSPVKEVKRAGTVNARISISMDGAEPSRLVIYDESSENFVINEDAWYMSPMNATQAASYFVKGSNNAAVSVQPEIGVNRLAVYTGSGTSHTISMPYLSGDLKVYLKDAVENREVCLNDNDYTFTAVEKTTITNRFTVSADIVTTGVDISTAFGAVSAYATADGIMLRGLTVGDQIRIFSADGVMVYSGEALDTSKNVSLSGSGVFVVKTGVEIIKVLK